MNFKQLVDAAVQRPGNEYMRSAVEKEILHVDILHALDGAGLLRDLVFQGGTSLHLCRGSARFSEDLDFAGGREFNTRDMIAIKACIEQHLSERYGLSIEVKEPKEQPFDPEQAVRVDKWQISVETEPGRRDVARQRVKLEIANIPAYTRELVPVGLQYDYMLGYGTILVNAETLDEIMADKVLAFPASEKNIRHRDIWDLAWLVQKGASLAPKLVLAKTQDYRINNYEQLLENAIARLPSIIKGKEFRDQMERFIDPATVERTLAQPAFLDFLTTTVGNVFKDMKAFIEAENAPKDSRLPQFRM